jgi:hypothetical protein
VLDEFGVASQKARDVEAEYDAHHHLDVQEYFLTPLGWLARIPPRTSPEPTIPKTVSPINRPKCTAG